MQHGGPVGLHVWGHHGSGCPDDGSECTQVSASDRLGASVRAVVCRCKHRPCEASVPEVGRSAGVGAQRWSWWCCGT
eukprot:5431500-Alexandrium_andersonii.AAC.1